MNREREREKRWEKQEISVVRIKSGLFQSNAVSSIPMDVPPSNKSGLFDIFVRDLLQYFMGHRTDTSLYKMSSYFGELICRF